MTTATRRPYAPRLPREQRRTQLLDAALAVLERDGYDGLSIEAIARQAGVTRPVVYAAFDGLHDLLMTLLDRQEARALSRLLAVMQEQPVEADPHGFVAGAIRRLVAMVRDDPSTWRPILLAPASVPTEVRERIDADRERFRAALAELVTSGAPVVGPRAVALDADVVAHMLLALLEYHGRLLLERPDDVDVDGLVAALRAILGGLAA